MLHTIRRVFLFLIIAALVAASAFAVLRYKSLRRQSIQVVQRTFTQGDPWTEGLARVKADRGEPMGSSAPIEIPTELRHYSDRHWFLATQVAEVRKFNVPSCQDFVDLGAMVQRGEMVSVPRVTDEYILLGVGEEADDKVFSRFEDNHDIEIYDETQLREAYIRLDSDKSTLQNEISDLKKQLAGLPKKERTKQTELRKELNARDQALAAKGESKKILDQAYGSAEKRQRLFREYESLQSLAKNFNGRAYDLSNPTERLAMKINMLSSLRPAGLKILAEVAKAYHDQFDRPLPVSSLVRPDQYQRLLRRVNRNAVLIDTPPHSTGLAFDIDYRYMTAAEQTFLMNELARLETEGRIEVLRERNANYHIFAFVEGRRPSDELITASLEDASVQTLANQNSNSKAAHHTNKTSVKSTSRTAERKSRTAKKPSRTAGRRKGRSHR